MNHRPLAGHRALSNHLIDSLADLRQQAEFLRAELYWNIQRASKSRRQSAAQQSIRHRQRSFRLHTGRPRDEIFPYNCPPHAA